MYFSFFLVKLKADTTQFFFHGKREGIHEQKKKKATIYVLGYIQQTICYIALEAGVGRPLTWPTSGRHLQGKGKIVNIITDADNLALTSSLAP